MTNLDRRMDFHRILEEILGNDHVYFQPPASKEIHYPCIIYNRTTGLSDYADNKTYRFRIQYQVIYISKDPDNEVILSLAQLPYSSMDRSYSAYNLNHDAFTIFY